MSDSSEKATQPILFSPPNINEKTSTIFKLSIGRIYLIEKNYLTTIFNFENEIGCDIIRQNKVQQMLFKN